MLVTQGRLALGEGTSPGGMASPAVGKAGVVRSLGACHRIEQAVRRPCREERASLPWVQGCTAGRTGVAAVSDSLMLGATLGCGPGGPGLGPLCSLPDGQHSKQGLHGILCEHGGLILPGAQQKTVLGSDLRQPQRVEGRCAKSGRSQTLSFQKASLCLRRSLTRSPGCVLGMTAEPLASFFSLLPSGFPPAAGCVCLTQTFLGKKLPN